MIHKLAMVWDYDLIHNCFATRTSAGISIQFSGAIRLMPSPLPIKDAIFISSDGTRHAKYGLFNLRSAFQPIYFSTSRGPQLYGYEALIRPEIDHSPVNLSLLFDDLEPTEQLYLESLCRSLHMQNFDFLKDTSANLFLNFDPAPYSNPELIDREIRQLRAEADNCGILPSQIVCEIIETENSKDQLVKRLCTRLRDMGMKIAVDDYGADHSNWDRFDLVRPEILKLDGEVFRNLCRTPAACAALKELVTSLDDANCLLLVEGIENQNQLDITISAGVSLFQGFHLAKPQTIAGQYPRIPAAPFVPDIAPMHVSTFDSTGSLPPFERVA